MVTRRSITPIPITLAVIKQEDALPTKEGMPSGLKGITRTEKILFDTAWITGVDYNEDQFEDKNYEEENSESENDVTIMKNRMMNTMKWFQTK